MTRRVLRLKQVQAQTGLSRSTIFALQQRGIFPQSIKIGPKATGWYEDEVQDYIETRPRTGGDRRGKAADQRLLSTAGRTPPVVGGARDWARSRRRPLRARRSGGFRPGDGWSVVGTLPGCGGLAVDFEEFRGVR